MNKTIKPKRRIFEGTVRVCAHNVYFYYDLPPRTRISDIDKTHLTEEAEERAKSQIIENYVQGELNYEDDRIGSRGWWNIKD
jgi:hypothetical protein